MSYVGDYKVAAVRRMKEDDSGFEKVSVSEIDMNSSLGQSLQHVLNSTLSITEDNQMITHMPIPEGVSEADIAEADKAGRIWNGKYMLDKKEVKIEDGILYLKDESKFLKGEEWAQISTENEGELDMVMMIYKKV